MDATQVSRKEHLATDLHLLVNNFPGNVNATNKHNFVYPTYCLYLIKRKLGFISAAILQSSASPLRAPSQYTFLDFFLSHYHLRHYSGAV